jgi:hypothetical protein
MNIYREESKALGSWRTEESRNTEPDRNWITGTRCDGEFYGSEPFGICRADWTGTYSIVESGRESPGGAIDELIENILEQLADSENRTANLKKQLDKVKLIRKRIEPTNGNK